MYLIIRGDSQNIDGMGTDLSKCSWPGTTAGSWRPPAVLGINPLVALHRWVLGVRRALSGLKTGSTHLLVWNYFIILTTTAGIRVHDGYELR